MHRILYKRINAESDFWNADFAARLNKLAKKERMKQKRGNEIPFTSFSLRSVQFQKQNSFLFHTIWTARANEFSREELMTPESEHDGDDR